MKTPLILAVERDPQQAAQLTSMFKRQFSAELVLVTSASAALKKLAGRVPELVLTSALIPPKDEVELVNWLRDLGSAADHVQTVTIPVLDGPVQVRVPAGASRGQQLRVRGKGLPVAGGTRGDLYAVIGIAMPTEVSAGEKELWEQLAAKSNFNPRKQ